MNSNLLNSYNKYVIANYKKFPVCLVRGEGSRVWDDEGNAYLDLFPGWGCGLLGHCPPLIVEAVKNQIGKESKSLLCQQAVLCPGRSW